MVTIVSPVWSKVNINRSGRPVLRENETIQFIRDDVGLYQGKSKIIDRQNGRVYLTNERIVYVDNKDGLKSIGVEISVVTNGIIIEGFLRSSPKVKVFYSLGRGEETPKGVVVDWVCKICSFNNHFDGNLDKLNRCVSCGIPPSRSYIEGLVKQGDGRQGGEHEGEDNGTVAGTGMGRDDQCPKCTFINHPSLKYCEMCGSELKGSVPVELLKRLESGSGGGGGEGMGTGGDGVELELEGEEIYTGKEQYIKLSFRTSGEVQFHECISKILSERHWQKLVSNGGVNKGATKVNENVTQDPQINSSGIYKLQLLREQTRKQNEQTLSASLEDLDQLMYKAQDLIKLSTSFKTLINESKTEAQKRTPSEVVDVHISPLTIKKESRFFNEELARHLSEYLINFKLTKTSSMITIQDLFADYNRYLIITQGFGTDLIEPGHLNKSIDLFEKLQLPIVVNKYDTGLKILRPQFNEDYSTTILTFLKNQEIKFKFDKYKQQFFGEFDQDDYFKETTKYFKGVGVNDVSEHFGWSVDISMEELNMLVQKGTVVLDQTIMGTFYFLNKFENYDFNKEIEDDEKLGASFREKVIQEQEALKVSITAQQQQQQQPTTAMTSGLETPNPMELQLNDNDLNNTLKQLSGLRFV